jgi:Na+/melibiose symporter-like transporter
MSEITAMSPLQYKGTAEQSTKRKKDNTGSLKELIENRTHLINLLCLLFLWITSAFDYYLINFQLKYIEGDIYTNTIVSSVSEVTAYIVSGALYERIGTKISFIGSFIIAIIGSLFLITLGDSHKEFIPVMVLGAKFGISGSFNVVYLANTLFPPVYSSTTFGVCNFVARLASMLAP